MEIPEAARKVIGKYNLSPLPGEGGFFRFIDSFGSGAGMIYFLITASDFSRLHKLTDDEVWFFLEGDAAKQLTFDEKTGRMETIPLDELNRNSVVRAGLYQTTFLDNPVRGYSLFSTVMSPRYNDGMYTHAPEELGGKYPELRKFI